MVLEYKGNIYNISLSAPHSHDNGEFMRQCQAIKNKFDEQGEMKLKLLFTA
jgi:hypothetical protein